jgi:hypothetical protein
LLETLLVLDCLVSTKFDVCAYKTWWAGKWPPWTMDVSLPLGANRTVSTVIEIPDM